MPEKITCFNSSVENMKLLLHLSNPSKYIAGNKQPTINLQVLRLVSPQLPVAVLLLSSGTGDILKAECN